MKFHGILPRSKLFPYSRVPWNSMELPISMEFHRIPWTFKFFWKKFHGIPWNFLTNLLFKESILLNIVFGIWLMIICYLVKTSQKRYLLHWFQYRNSYFEHPSVSEIGARSANMACCYQLFHDYAEEKYTHSLCVYDYQFIVVNIELVRKYHFVHASECYLRTFIKRDEIIFLLILCIYRWNYGWIM